MPVNWPVFLQQFLNVESFSIRRGVTYRETENSIGAPKVRRYTTRPIDTYTVTINVPETVAIQFDNFYNTTLNGGVTPFYFTDPFRKSVATFRMTGELGIAPLGSSGQVWRVSMTWIKLP